MSGAKTKLILATITIFLSTTLIGSLLPFTNAKVKAAPFTNPPATFSYSNGDPNTIVSAYKADPAQKAYWKFGGDGTEFNLTFTLADPVSKKAVYDSLKVATNQRLYTAPSSPIAGTTGGCFSYIVLDGAVGALNPASGQVSFRQITGGKCANGIMASLVTAGGKAQQLFDTPRPIIITGASSDPAFLAAITTPDASKATGGADPGGTDPAGTCEGSVMVVGWIVCAITEAADSLINFFETSLEDILRINPEIYQKENPDTGVNELHTAWSAVRIIASVLLVGIVLFMVIAQMVSSDSMSAYTLKKLIPRLVIAAILIQLSWFLFTSMIGIVNVIGDGLQQLLFAPFGGANQIDNITAILQSYYKYNPVGAPATETAIVAAGGVFAVGVAVMSGAGLAVGLFLGGLALSMLIAIMVVYGILVIRLILIISLLVISPLALVAWILPNTQNLWKTWWKLFTDLLMMYPIIVLLLSVGKIVAYLVSKL